LKVLSFKSYNEIVQLSFVLFIKLEM